MKQGKNNTIMKLVKININKKLKTLILIIKKLNIFNSLYEVLLLMVI